MFPTLPHLLQRIVRSVRKERRPHKSRHAQQPRLLVLEERALLSTLTVTSSADCATQNDTLRYAVDQAQSGDTILLTAAITDPIVLSLGELVVSQSVTIESVPGRTPTISGDGSRVFEISAGAQVTLDNLNIVDGNGVADNPSGSADYDGDGGAILNFGTLTVDSCTLGSNVAFIGGAITSFGTLTVNGSTLSGNSAAAGGGVFNLGPLTISDSQFEANQASFYGGGLCNYGQMNIKVLDSGFTGNSAGNSGGAISNSAGGTGSVSGCRFTGNSAGGGGGGGISVFSGALTLANDTFAENTTTGFGGGVEVAFGAATVIGCTFTNNFAAVQGGGIADEFGTLGILSVGTSAFSGNTPDDIFGVYTDLGGNTFF